MSRMTYAQREEYVLREGSGCPYCGPDADVEGGSIIVEGGSCSQLILCLNCDAGWYDCYTLTSIEEVVEED